MPLIPLWTGAGLPDRRERLVDAGLTTLLLLQGFTLFVALPLSAQAPWGRVVLDCCHVLFALVCIGVLTRHRGAQGVLLVTLLLLVAGPTAGRAVGADLDLSPAAQHEIIALAAFAFNGAVTGVAAVHVFAPGRRVTAHRVRGAVLLYLNVAALFAIAYGLVAMNMDGAFLAAGRPLVRAGPGGGVALFSYFSLATITTTGYGDIVPVHPAARSLANLEAVFGALFPATLLSRLVTLHLRDDGDTGLTEPRPGGDERGRRMPAGMQRRRPDSVPEPGLSLTDDRTGGDG